MKKFWLLFTALFIVTSTFVSCKQKEQKKEIVIAIIPKLDNAIFDQVKESAIQSANDLGIVLTWEAPASIDGAKQKELIENLIKYKVDGILISCNDAEMMKEPINKAVKAGIKVGTFDSDCPKSDRIFYVGTDNQKAGEVCAETMISLYKKANLKPDQIVILSGGTSALNLKERLIGFRSVFKEGKLVDVLYSFEMPDYGKEILTIELNRNKNINGIQMLWGVPALSGLDSFPAINQHMKKGSVAVFFDVSKSLLKFIKDNPNCATIKQDFHSMGHDGVTNLYNAIIGKPYELQIMSDVKVIDKSNVDEELKKL